QTHDLWLESMEALRSTDKQTRIYGIQTLSELRTEEAWQSLSSHFRSLVQSEQSDPTINPTELLQTAQALFPWPERTIPLLLEAFQVLSESGNRTAATRIFRLRHELKTEHER